MCAARDGWGTATWAEIRMKGSAQSLGVDGCVQIRDVLMRDVLMRDVLVRTIVLGDSEIHELEIRSI